MTERTCGVAFCTWPLSSSFQNFGEEKLKEELKKLQEDKNLYQTTAKGFFKKALEEKLEAVQKCQEVKRLVDRNIGVCLSYWNTYNIIFFFFKPLIFFTACVRSLINAEAQCSSLNEELEKNREQVQNLAQRLSAQIARNEDLELKLQVRVCSSGKKT